MSLTPNLPNIPPRPPGRDPNSVFVAESSWQGPLPPPEILQGYEAAFPGAAERILRMAEDQGAHRRDMEKQALGIQKEGIHCEFAEARLG